ncbi:MAG: CRISPR-associated endonuclease Cas1 [Xanthobacteraceae bacterium]|nr:CRISPR-associated endonuclease Cas1 [Xanthobacteraceae bacterium]
MIRKIDEGATLLAALEAQSRGDAGALAAARRRMAEASALAANAAATPDLHVLRGREGAAARAFFPAYATAFTPALGFAGRNRRPPRDPVNVCLSLGYTLAHAEALRAAARTGLDPQLGVYHDLAPGRDSLACDLAEPVRPLVDGFVQRAFADAILRPGRLLRAGRDGLRPRQERTTRLLSRLRGDLLAGDRGDAGRNRARSRPGFPIASRAGASPGAGAGSGRRKGERPLTTTRTHLVAYDVRAPRRLARVHRALSGVGHHLQYSVFAVDLDEPGRERLVARLARLVDVNQDDVRVYLVPGEPRGAWHGPLPGAGTFMAAGAPAATLAARLAAMDEPL